MFNLRKGHLMRGAALSLWFFFAAGVLAQDHIVPPEELSRRAAAASESRQANLAAIEKFFSTETARTVLSKGNQDPGSAIRATCLLSDEELARLAVRVRKAQNDFAAGALSNQELTYIVIALATAVIILVILKA